MLSVEKLSFWYQLSEPPIVYECDLTVNEGEFVAVVGRSGGGKTTLLRLCCGLLQLEIRENLECKYRIEGSVKFGDQLVDHPLDAFSYVPQHFREGLHPAKTAKDNILMAVLEDGISPEENALADELMAATGITDSAEMNILRLSGGQQQRVAICQALIKKPAFIFMDEPFANLDQTLRPTMQKMLDSLRKDFRFSLLCVTHDIEGAVCLADKVLKVNSQYSIPIYKPFPIPSDLKDDLKDEQRLNKRREIEKWTPNPQLNS